MKEKNRCNGSAEERSRRILSASDFSLFSLPSATEAYWRARRKEKSALSSQLLLRGQHLLGAHPRREKSSVHRLSRSAEAGRYEREVRAVDGEALRLTPSLLPTAAGGQRGAKARLLSAGRGRKVKEKEPTKLRKPLPLDTNSPRRRLEAVTRRCPRLPTSRTLQGIVVAKKKRKKCRHN